jgi:hypothetical protein
MLSQRMKSFGKFAAAFFAIGWGAFTILALPEGYIPREMVWLGVVIGTGAALAVAVFVYLRRRSS